MDSARSSKKSQVNVVSPPVSAGGLGIDPNSLERKKSIISTHRGS